MRCLHCISIIANGKQYVLGVQVILAPVHSTLSIPGKRAHCPQLGSKAPITIPPSSGNPATHGRTIWLDGHLNIRPDTRPTHVHALLGLRVWGSLRSELRFSITRSHAIYVVLHSLPFKRGSMGSIEVIEGHAGAKDRSADSTSDIQTWLASP